MTTRCKGGWNGNAHVPADLGGVPSELISDGMCDRCARAMGELITCRWCKKVDTAIGLCERCELALSSNMGRPIAELSVYRQGSAPLTGQYDGAGAMLRLRASMQEPGYAGFQLRALVVPI